MEKDFNRWNGVKQMAHGRSDTAELFFREKEIWWCMLGVNIGDEQDGKGCRLQRPVLIVKKFNQRIFLAIPLTTKVKTNPFYVPIYLSDGLPRCAIISQIRLLDIKRLTEKMHSVNDTDFVAIKKAIRGLFA